MSTQEINTQEVLPVMEHFYTIQGEGFHSGRAAYFIRLAGCDVGCVWCDVKESWEVSDSQFLKIDFLMTEIQKSGTDFVVITGGEPAMYNLSFIVSLLKDKDIEVAIETSGTHPLTGNVNWYCFSPKKFKKPVEEAYVKANELKVIVYHESDFKWAEEHAQKVNAHCQLFLQPEWSKQDLFLPKIIDYVKEHPRWKISLQTHKFMNIP
jgi:7-carboxy-7-deazaguanine synthase